MSGSTGGGAFYFARIDDVCVIRLVGTITWNISTDLERFLDDALGDDSVKTFFLDLSPTLYIDSTNLGLLARVYLAVSSRRERKALLHSTRPAINTILDDVGFTEIFARTDTNPYESVPVEPIPGPRRAGDHRGMILQAHRDLARLNDRNRDSFRTVVEEMERDMDREN